MPPCQCSMPGFGKGPRDDAALPLRCKMSQSVDITDLQNVSDRSGAAAEGCCCTCLFLFHSPLTPGLILISKKKKKG